MTTGTQVYDVELTRPYAIVRRSAAEGDDLADVTEVIVEHVLDLYVNERLLCQLVCTPNRLEELVLGYLFTSGVVRSLDQVDVLNVCRSGARAKVFLAAEVTSASLFATLPRRVLSECGDNMVFAELRAGGRELQKLPPHIWSPEIVFALASRFQEGATLYAATRAVHSCLLSVAGEILYVCEDIGRHNAVDKAIGCAARDGVEMEDVVLFVSGRVPSDMVRKAIVCGIPVIASRSVPTDHAIALAQQYGLTLMGSVTAKRMNVFTQ